MYAIWIFYTSFSMLTGVFWVYIFDVMAKPQPIKKTIDRKLGDEWLDWDGKGTPESTDTDSRVFLGLAILTTFLLILAAGLFLWLIYPRLISAGSLVAEMFSILFLAFGAVLLVWLLLFVWAAITRRPITRFVIIPHLVNKLLSLVTAVGRVMGISKERLTNSFLKVHNIIIGSRSVRAASDRLLLLLPRCLTRETNIALRKLRDAYGFRMATALFRSF